MQLMREAIHKRTAPLHDPVSAGLVALVIAVSCVACSEGLEVSTNQRENDSSAKGTAIELDVRVEPARPIVERGINTGFPVYEVREGGDVQLRVVARYTDGPEQDVTRAPETRIYAISDNIRVDSKSRVHFLASGDPVERLAFVGILHEQLVTMVGFDILEAEDGSTP